jgi:sucrose-6-phosphate hydrolase SacC (GH32 family)
MPESLEILIERQYLNLPVKDGAPLHKICFCVNDQVVRFFDLEWAEGEPDFWVFTDVSSFKGERLVIEVSDAEKQHEVDREHPQNAALNILKAVIHSDTIVGGENLYQEKHRPQFHFTSRRGWHNDPNGLVYYEGTYHLFYQHNLYSWHWGKMHWGHAVSKNLVQWEELPDVLHPDGLGTMYSGSAFVDWDNTAGLKKGSNDTLICFYTAAGEWVEPKVPYTQCMAYSNDGGWTWQKYEGNPILPHIAAETRDPCVIWHQDSEQWIMALYIAEEKDKEKEPHHFALFASPDLRSWARLQEIYLPGRGECPDFFPMPLDGNRENTKWVFWAADGHYLIGTFDGNRFSPETDIKSTYCAEKELSNGYAAQTWSDIPPEDGRRIQIAWLVGDFPGMPFNQQMTFPVELTLKTTDDGPRLHFWPVREIENLYQEKKALEEIELSEDPTVLPTDGHDLLDIHTTINVGDADEIELNLRGTPLVYNISSQEISCCNRTAQLITVAGNIHLRVLLDRASIEVFAADGLVYIPHSVIPQDHNYTCFLQTRGGRCLAKTVTITKLNSSWK